MSDTTRIGASEYWDRAVAAGFEGIWRKHADCVNRHFVGPWLQSSPAGPVLKTDAFDEAVGAGPLAPRAEGDRPVLCIDVSPATAARASSRRKDLRFLASDVRMMPFAGGTIATVVSLSTLDHFETADEISVALDEIFRVLQPGGRLILSLDNPINPAVWLRSRLPMTWLNRIGLVPYFVGATLTETQLKDALRTAGFEVLASGCILHCPRVVVLHLCGLVDRLGERARQRWLRVLAAFEALGRWPTRSFTAHFNAVLAVKPSLGSG